MTTIQEGRQFLDFDSSWKALQWDTAGEFVGSMEKALHQLDDSVKAVDVVGVRDLKRQPKMLLVSELKDFAHPDIPAEKAADVALRAVSDELMQAVVRKVIDSLAGATFAHDANDDRCDGLSGWLPALGRTTTTLLVLLCIEVPKSQEIAALAWTKELQHRLRWLGPNAHVLVTNSARPFTGNGLVYHL